MRLVDIEPIVELVKGEHEKVQDSFNKANLWKEPNSVARYGEALQEIGAFIGLMINAPTVEAIPIEWLKNWNPKEWNDTGYQVMRRIIDDWEKRNETD